MEDVPKRRGRPSVYTPDMCDRAIELMSQGASKTEVAATLDIGISTLKDWCDSKSPFYIEVFSAAINTGMDLSKTWWERTGRKAVIGEVDKFSAPTWIFTMKNRFRDDYADDQNINLGGQHGTNPVETIVTVNFVKPLVS